MIAFIKDILADDTLLLYLGLVSLLFFIITLIVIPWLILQIPYDYFAEARRQSFLDELHHPLLRLFLLILKNLLGTCFLILGIALLVLPGQGLLTILLGMILIDFPGKYHLQRWLVSKKSVLNSINWLREKGNKAPIKL